MRVELRYGPVWTGFFASGADASFAIHKHMGQVPNPRFRAGGDEPRFYNFLKGGQFLTGLTDWVEPKLVADGVEVVRTDFPEWPAVNGWKPDLLGSDLTLRPYQVEAVKACIVGGRGVVEIATGGGKTLVSKALTRALGTPRTLFLCPDTAALRDMYRRFSWVFGRELVGRYGEGYSDSDRQIVIATVQGLMNGLKRGRSIVTELLEDIELLFVDEVHRYATADAWREVILYCRAARRIALSGTPFNAGSGPYDPEDMVVRGLAGRTLVKLSVSKLTEMGYLTPCSFIRFPAGGEDNYVRSWNWATVYKEGIVRNMERNERIVTLATNLADAGARPLVTIDHLDHGRALQYMLLANGILSVCAYGSGALFVPRELLDAFGPVKYTAPGVKRGQRWIPYIDLVRHTESRFVRIEADKHPEAEVRVRELFEEGAVAVLIGSRIFDEVQNIPFLTDLITAAGYKRGKRVRQRIGRVLRLYPGKTAVRVWDPQDTVHKFLSKHSEERESVARDEGHRVADGRVAPAECLLRFRDVLPRYLRRADVQLTSVSVKVGMSLPLQNGAMAHPEVELTAALDEGEDGKAVVQQLGVKALGAWFQEAHRQSYWLSQVATAGVQASLAQFIEHRKG